MLTERTFKPALVGRSAELETLRAGLERACAGSGSAILVSGEAGIGKSRLCEEALATAEVMGASVARGWCVEGSLEPLHSVREALAGLGIEGVLDDAPPPELLCLYLLDQGGVLVASAAKKDSGVDADIFSGMLQAISNFAKDSLAQLGVGAASYLGSIAYGEYRIVIRNSGGLSLASILRGAENEPLLAEMDGLLSELGPGLAGWTGKVAETAEAKRALESLARGGRYVGRHLVDDPGLRKSGLLSSILAGLARKAAEKPLVLYLDDLQWADPTTVSLVHYLARNASGTRMMILGTFRPEDVAAADGKTHPLASAIKTMSREGVVSIVRLERLETGGSRDLVESALDGCTLEEAFYSRLQRDGGGNPFYTLELLRLMRDSGTLARDPGGKWRLAKSVDEVEMPGRVADIVMRRLDRMPNEDVRLISAASVLGEEFSLDALCDLTKADRMDLAGRLDSIEAGTGLVRSGAAEYRFDHSKVREAAYARLGAGMRRELHRLAADSLLKSGASGRLSEIAIHLDSAGDPRAPARLVLAARDAKGRFAMDEAARLYKLAARRGALDRGDSKELADCERHLGLYDSAMVEYKDLLGGALGKERGVLLTMMAEVKNLQSAWDDAVALGNDAFVFLEPLGPSRELAWACHVLYQVSQKRGAMKDAEAWALRQVELAKAAADPAAWALAENDLGTMYLHISRFDDALPHLEAAAAKRRFIGDLVGLAASLNNIGAVLHKRGSFQKATEYYRESLAIKRAIGDARGIATTTVNLSYTFKSSGDLSGALRFMEESLGIRKRIGDLTGQCSCISGIGYLRFEMMDFEKAERSLTEGVELAERIGAAPDLGIALANLGDVLFNLGRLEEARLTLERGVAIARDINDRLMQSLCRATLADVCVAEGKLDEADDILALVKSSADEMKADNLMADYHKVAGRLCAARNRDDEARAHFLGAIEIRTKLKDGFPLARAKRDYAAFSRARGDTGTADRLAREILEYAKGVGAERLASIVAAENPHLS